MSYDLIVLGGGPAGYLASERAGHLTGEIIINDGGYSHLDRVLT